MSVTVCNWTAWRSPWPSRQMGQLLAVMLEAVNAARVQVEAHVVRDGPMACENARHMGCCGPTNVLSFPSMTGQNPCRACVIEELPGIVLLSVDTLDRECLLYGQDRQEHALRLLAHGLAHVLGHDHGSTMDAFSLQMEEAGRAFLLRQEQKAKR